MDGLGVGPLDELWRSLSGALVDEVIAFLDDLVAKYAAASQLDLQLPPGSAFARHGLKEIRPATVSPTGTAFDDVMAQIVAAVGGPVRLWRWRPAPGAAETLALVAHDGGVPVLALAPLLDGGGPRLHVVAARQETGQESRRVVAGRLTIAWRATGAVDAVVPGGPSAEAGSVHVQVSLGEIPLPAPLRGEVWTDVQVGTGAGGFAWRLGAGLGAVRLDLGAVVGLPLPVPVSSTPLGFVVTPERGIRLDDGTARPRLDTAPGGAGGPGSGGAIPTGDATTPIRLSDSTPIRQPDPGGPNVAAAALPDPTAVSVGSMTLALPDPSGRLDALTATIAADTGAILVRVVAEGRVELGPVRLAFGDTGTDVRVELLAGGALLAATVTPHPPGRLGGGIDLGTVQGSGALSRHDGDWTGVFDLTLGTLAVTGFGVLTPARRSFVAVLAAQFPEPGLQVGFGFALHGVGGVLGVNRRVDLDALRAGVQDGSAAQLLFPTDPVAAFPQLEGLLRRAFPESAGSVFTGPMFELTWGGGLVRVAVAVIVELPDPVRLTILGRLRCVLPAEHPLVDLRAFVVGTFDPSVPETTLLASLQAASVGGVTIDGDLFVLVRGGSAAAFVFSVGGLHPRFPAPRGVPALRRVHVPLFPVVRLEGYFALTSNSVQFGARAELAATIADCGVHGHFAFDALFVWAPRFHLEARVSASVAVEVFGADLIGIALEIDLSGPGPWHARVSGRIETFLFDIPLDLEITSGTPGPVIEPLAPAVIRDRLRAVLSDAHAWTAGPPADTAGVQVITPPAGAQAVHPSASLEVRQREVPLGLRIDRFDEHPVAPQTWRLVRARIGAVEVDAGRLPRRQELFAAGRYQQLAEDQQLARPAFEPHEAGWLFSPAETILAQRREVRTQTWETKYANVQQVPVPPPRPYEGVVVDRPLGDLLRYRKWWRSPRPPAGVAAVGETVGWKVVHAATLAPTRVATVFASRALAEEAAEPGELVVEQWEALGG
jgi:hypothetical protein